MTTRLLQLLTENAQHIRDSLAPLNQDGDLKPEAGFLQRTLQDLTVLVGDDTLPFKISSLPAYVDLAKNMNTGIDDRKFLLEYLIVLMSRMPPNWQLRDQIQKEMILLLYNDLPHPPSGYLATLPTNPANSASTAAKLSKNLTYAARSADGSNYNTLFPELGMAGMPYARSVPSTNRAPASSLPDPGLVFDTLLRRDKFKPHPDGVSALFFAFADLVIHSIFNTNNLDWTINNASSYLDLSPLYGSSEKEINQVRRLDGTGRLWDDVFADSRLLLMPPATCALLVLLNRNHNYIASKLLEINENANLKNPPPEKEDDRRTQDDEIFSRARLVNCGYFMQIILGDYVGSILGLVRDQQTWRLDPLQYARSIDHSVSPRGEGNVVSLEFNLLYRWHATISEHDADWTTKELTRLFDGKDLSTVTVNDFKEAAHKYLVPTGTVKEWEFDGVKRGPDGRFADQDLANIIQTSTESYAAAFGARGTPECLRVIEVLGIMQARSWGACSMNEFRSFIGLKPYKSFEEWNKDPEIHTAAAALYGDIDNLELHVGLQAEESKVPMPGAGLCPGYTISRAILADAVCLTRGDRFLTTEFTPFNLTSWGYQDCMFDTKDGSYGGELTKLLFRTLPAHYPVGSAYAHFPFAVPQHLEKLWRKDGKLNIDKYTWTRPPVPQPTVVVSSPADVAQVLNNTSIFPSTYDARLHKITGKATLDRGLVQKVLLKEGAHWGNIFAKKAEILIKEKSFTHVGSSLKYLDAAKDVANLAPMYVVAQDILGLPLKTVREPRGSLREQDAFNQFATIFRYIFNESEPYIDFHLRESSSQIVENYVSEVVGHLKELNGTFEALKSYVKSYVGISTNHFLKEYLRCAQEASHNRSNLRNLAASLIAEVVPTTAFVSECSSLVVDFYLNDDQEIARKEIAKLYAAGDLQAIAPFVWTAMRKEPPVAAMMRTAVTDCQLSSLQIKAGQRVVVTIPVGSDVEAANGSGPKIGRFDPLGIPEHSLFSANLFEIMVAQVVGPILTLPNVKRAPGNSGILSRVDTEDSDMKEQRFVDWHGDLLPWPSSLIVQYGA